MLNNIVVMGRLTRDPETKVLSNASTVTQFTVASDRDYQKAGGEKLTDFIPCRAWRQIGEFVEKYFQKGSMIVVEGRLHTDSWTDAEGNRHTSTYINVDRAHFGEKKKDASGEKPYTTYNRERSYRPDISAADFEEMADDGELPF